MIVTLLYGQIAVSKVTEMKLQFKGGSASCGVVKITVFVSFTTKNLIKYQTWIDLWPWNLKQVARFVKWIYLLYAQS